MNRRPTSPALSPIAALALGLTLGLALAPPLAAQQGAGWTTDPRSGCRVWKPFPHEVATTSWSGGCSNGLADGVGKIEWRNDKGQLLQSYEGPVKAGKAQGRGKAVFGNGARYEGDFADGDLNGHGTYDTPDGGRYVGQMRNGDYSGRGTFTWKSGDRYEGQWANDKANGQGTKTLPDGRSYSGQWTNGCFRQGDRWSTVGTTAEACGFR